MKIIKGGHTGRKDIVLYKGQPLEYVISFEYLDVTKSVFMRDNVHISKLHREGVTSVNILAAKVNFQKILFLSILPSCSHGLSTTTSSTNFLVKVIAYFWKRWTGISKCTSNSKPIHHLYEDDFMEKQKSKQPRRRSIALFYTNGLHRQVFTLGNCYGNSTDTFCDFKFCGQHINSPQDL